MSDQKRERLVFDACLDLAPKDRAPYLKQAFADEPDLRDRVAALLDAHDRALMDNPFRPVLSRAAMQKGSADDSQLITSLPYCHRCQKNIQDRATEKCSGCGAARPARGWPSDALLGRTVAGGQYRIVHRLGSGGFGVVYEVETVVGGLRRALKVLREDWAEEQSVRRRFINEAVALEKISHPNVARCFAAGTLDQDGEPYLLFELINGVPLSSLVGRSEDAGVRRFEPLRAVRLARQVGSGLVAAHAKHVLHRDLKPANVMILDAGGPTERVKLLDFGIAKFVEAELTWTAGVIGTPAFMAPEQFFADSAQGHTVDLWQLGALLFVMLTGRTPYDPEEKSLLAFRDLHRPADQPGPRPSELLEHLAAHPALDKLVARLLSTNPADRPASAAEVCHELARIEQSLSPGLVSSRSALLDALCAKPSRDSWIALCRYLEDQDVETREAAAERLGDWPHELRRAAIPWWHQVSEGRASPLWTLVCTLDLSAQGLTDDDVARIAGCAALRAVRILNLAGNSIGPEGAAALAESGHLDRLERLDLSGNPIGGRGVASLAGSRHLKRLRTLSLAGARIDASGLERLVESRLPLQYLDLSDNDLGVSGASAVAGAGLTGLRTLKLRNNRLCADGAAKLAVSPLFAGVQTLDLAHNSIGPAGVAALALSRHMNELRHLVLAQNNLGREGLQLLLSSNALEWLETLDISSNSVRANGAMALASSLLARRIRVLNLRDNEVGDTGLAALLGSPQLTGLSALDISNNGLTPSGTGLFDGAALQLDCLDLSDNELGRRGGESVSKAVGQLRLRRLRVRRTGLSLGDIALIVQAGKGNLVELDASDNEVQSDEAKSFISIPELISMRSLSLDRMTAERSALVAVLSSPYLTNVEELGLNSNRLGDDGLAELCAMSGLARLTRLSLQDNGIGYKGAAALTASPLAAHIACLDLSYNELGDTGAEALSTGKNWHQLQEIHLRGNGIGFGGAAGLTAAKGMSMLQVVNLADNPLFGELDLYNLAQNKLALVESSFARISGMGKQFAETFYEKLFDRFPEVKPLFAHVSMSRQQHHLVSSLVMIIENLRSPDTLSASLTALSRRHVGYGVRPAHYEAFGTAFLEALREVMGEEWSESLRDAWSEALQAISRVMINAHKESKSKP